MWSGGVWDERSLRYCLPDFTVGEDLVRRECMTVKILSVVRTPHVPRWLHTELAAGVNWTKCRMSG